MTFPFRGLASVSVIKKRLARISCGGQAVVDEIALMIVEKRSAMTEAVIGLRRFRPRLKV